MAGDSQTIIVGESSSGYPGWYDPRINGGRFLDVRLRFGDVGLICVAVTDAVPELVHESQASVPRRAFEHRRRRILRSLHPH